MEDAEMCELHGDPGPIKAQMQRVLKKALAAAKRTAKHTRKIAKVVAKMKPAKE